MLQRVAVWCVGCSMLQYFAAGGYFMSFVLDCILIVQIFLCLFCTGLFRSLLRQKATLYLSCWTVFQLYRFFLVSFDACSNESCTNVHI